MHVATTVNSFVAWEKSLLCYYDELDKQNQIFTTSIQNVIPTGSSDSKDKNMMLFSGHLDSTIEYYYTALSKQEPFSSRVSLLANHRQETGK